jgi:two-component system CitB family sensor kinase
LEPSTTPTSDNGAVRRGGRARRAVARSVLPERLRWLVAYREVLSGSGAAGTIIIDTRCRVRLWSEGATRLLGTCASPGTALGETPLPPAVLRAVLADGDVDGAAVTVEGLTLRVDSRPVRFQGEVLGRAFLVHDVTEVLRLDARLRAEREETAALRARAHEADNRLHTVVSLVELGHARQAVDFATAALARSDEVHESIRSAVSDPVLAALLLGKAACADEAGVSLHVDPSTTMRPVGIPSSDLVLLLGNLVDNGIDAAAATPPPRWVHILARTTAVSVRLEVSDSGPGLSPELVGQAFTAGWTTKAPGSGGEAHGRGLGLALVAAAARRLGGTVTVDRWVGARFTVEVPLPGGPGRAILT